MPAHYYAYLTFLDSMKSLHNDFVNDKENASMAHHLARRTKREKEHPMCGAAPLSPQFGAKVQKKLFSNKFFREKIEGGLPTPASAPYTTAPLLTSAHGANGLPLFLHQSILLACSHAVTLERELAVVQRVAHRRVAGSQIE